MQALVPTQTRTPARALAVVTLLWALVGAPGQAAADACAYASTGPDGTEAVAIAGHIDWDVPPCSPPPPPPRHRATEVRRQTRSTTSPLVFVLLIITPAVVAVAALRPR
ncbi:hypothetical protein [Streptomyces sp. E2N171]|uniref:hypothetical protein n=1 Tax=Streptomyces sp. E2N171 TaxID=1851914 RepID=UPI00187D664B|nr:hypothetical protein [Streptomyces sp. E2N171]